MIRWTHLGVAAFGLAMSAAGCECEDGSPPLGRLSAEIKVDPEEIDFGQVPTGAVIEQPVTVKNVGTDVLRICLVASEDIGGCTEPTIVDPATAPFETVFEGTSASGHWNVDRGETRDFLVRFKPQQEGSFVAVLVLMHNASNGPFTEIVLKGGGVAPNIMVSQRTFDFGDVNVSQRKELELTMTNGTQFAQPFKISAIAQDQVIFGTSNSGQDTPEGQELSAQIPGNGSLTVHFWYRPPEEGDHRNQVTLSWGCQVCTATVGLSGRGVRPRFELDPQMLDFGMLDEGQAGTKTFVVRNIGNTPFVVQSAELEVGSTPEFNVTPDDMLPRTLNPTETTQVTVKYTGTTPGRDSGRVQVTTDAWDDPNTTDSESIGFVDLLAVSSGPDIDPLPSAIQFGTVAIMGAPSTKNLLIANSGNSPLDISSITLDSMTPEITVRTAPMTPLQVAPGGSTMVTLAYAPTNGGLDTADLVIVSNDRDEGTLRVPIQGIGGVPTTCAVSVAPTRVTFGLVERGRRASLPVEIRNTGAQPCSISNIILNGDPAFSLTSGSPTMLTVAPGSSQRVSVDYAPAAYGSHVTNLEFTTDDPTQMTMTVPISGASAMSNVRVIPSELNFNVVPVTCRSPNRAITIYNTGSTPVRITRVYLDPSTSPEFELQPFTVPTSVAAGGSATINLRYRPADIGTDTGVLFIEHDQAMAPVAVPLAGEGALNPTVTDEFRQLPTPQADVLFVVDNSCSMDQEQASLGRNLSSFLSYAQTAGIDYQIGVTTTDVDSLGERGRFVPVTGAATNRIIRPNTSNAATVFMQNVNQGTDGSGTERGLEAAYLALSDPLINTHNAGFLRTDATLAVIIVSDEEDYSSRTIQFYQNFFRNIKGFQNAAQFSLSAIVGTTMGGRGCTGPGGSAEYGSRYIQVAQGTGGVVESICNANWGQTLANIGLNSFGLKRQFVLSSQPVPATINVEVDGTRVPTVTPGGQQRWTYDQSTNSVNFQVGAVPQANAVIHITYTVACLP